MFETNNCEAEPELISKSVSSTKKGHSMEMNPGQRLVNVHEAAKYLAVSVSTLYGWAWQRKLPFVKVGRALRFDLADLEKFIRINRTEARSSVRFSGN
jgi:excisionase family DNA binding protein